MFSVRWLPVLGDPFGSAASTIGCATLFMSSAGRSPSSLLASTGTASADQRRVELHGPAVVVTVAGPVDGPCSDEVSDYVYRFVPRGSALVVNVTDIGFLWVQGLGALVALTRGCGRAGVDWAAGTSHSMIRLLRVLSRRDGLFAAAALALRGIEQAQAAPKNVSRCSRPPIA